MQGWRNTMEDAHIAKVLDETPGNNSDSELPIGSLALSNIK